MTLTEFLWWLLAALVAVPFGIFVFAWVAWAMDSIEVEIEKWGK